MEHVPRSPQSRAGGKEEETAESSASTTPADLVTVEAEGETGPPVSYDEERLSDMQTVLEPRNLRILQQLLASDTGALSPKEVAFRNPDIDESTVRDHLRELTNADLTEKLTPEVDHIPNRIPRTYYAVSEYGIDLMKSVGVYEGLAIVYQIYDRLDRPEEIRETEEWEHRPVPEWL